MKEWLRIKDVKCGFCGKRRMCTSYRLFGGKVWFPVCLKCMDLIPWSGIHELLEKLCVTLLNVMAEDVGRFLDEVEDGMEGEEG